MVKIKDVAEASGFDSSTVSRVLNSDSKLVVKPETRAKILKIARELNYRPNATARSLKTGETYTIGMIIPYIYDPIYREIFKGVDNVLSREGYYVITVSTDDKLWKKNAYMKLLNKGRVDGVLLASSFVNDDLTEALEGYSMPIIAINRFSRGLDNYVLIDDKGAARQAVKHLTMLGHTKITHLSGPLMAYTALERYQGYRLALQDAGIEFINSLVVETDYSDESGYTSMKNLLATNQTFTAVFATNVSSALGAIAAIKEAGLKIPNDISIICIHDIPIAALVDPPLTTIKMPLYEMGREAAEMLLRLIRKEEGYKQKVIKGFELMLRSSTAPPSIS